MARYAIGDLQGCWFSFQELLDQLSFRPERDQLYLAGDLVNRGNGSAEVLAFCHQHSVKAVLGNHDLHLLACLFGTATARAKDTIDGILNSTQRKTYTEYLLSLPLLIREEDLIMAHAGFWPGWSADQLEQQAHLAQSQWQATPDEFFKHMYGNHPTHPDQAKDDRELTRFTVNALTRMRMLTPALELELKYKGPPQASSSILPWYQGQHWLKQSGITGLFGHWAALGSKRVFDQLIALDGGCVWGERLTAYNLDTHQFHHQPTHPKDIQR